MKTQLRRYYVVLREIPEVVSKPTKTSKNAAKCHFLSAIRDLVVYAPKTNDHYTSFQENHVSGCQKTSLLKNFTCPALRQYYALTCVCLALQLFVVHQLQLILLSRIGS